MSSDDQVLWQELEKDDPAAWKTLLEQMVFAAMQQIRAGFELPAEEDQQNPAAAFYSAWPSFLRHFLVEKDLQDAQDLETLASHFVRIAYNRSQRKKRQAQKMQQGLNQGRGQNSEGEMLAFDPLDPSQIPEDLVSREEFLAYLRKLVDEEVEALKVRPRDYQIIRTWVDKNLQITQVELSKRLKVQQSRVSRVRGTFLERIRRRLQEADQN